MSLHTLNWVSAGTCIAVLVAGGCALPEVSARAPDAGAIGVGSSDGDSGAHRRNGATQGEVSAENMSDAQAGRGGQVPVTNASEPAIGSSGASGMGQTPANAVASGSAGSGSEAHGLGSAGAAGGAIAPAVMPPPITTEHAMAEWPMPDALEGSKTKPSYSVNDTTVTDNITRLEWQRAIPSTYDDCTGKYDQDGVVGDSCTWQEARLYCASAALAALLGGSGWRLPTKIELESIIDETRYDPSIDSDAFPNTRPDSFWSTSPAVARGQNYAWFVEFSAGGTLAFLDNSSYRVRCVRSGGGR